MDGQRIVRIYVMVLKTQNRIMTRTDVFVKESKQVALGILRLFVSMHKKITGALAIGKIKILVKWKSYFNFMFPSIYFTTSFEAS